MRDTPITDAAEESDSHAFQILYPHLKYRGVKGDRMRVLEREHAKLREAARPFASETFPQQQLGHQQSQRERLARLLG